jgi:hypothetical protein
MLLMSKKKQADRHKKPRKAVQMPEEWYTVAEELAAEQKMPLLWLLIDLLNKAGETAGKKDLPALPWSAKKKDDEDEEE